MVEEIRFTGLRNQTNNNLLSLKDIYILDEHGVPLRKKTFDELKAEEKETKKKQKKKKKKSKRKSKKKKKQN